MNRALGFVLLLSTLVLVSPAKADTSTNVKCVGNEDRVWVYESLTDFNVAAKLKCGDPIQIIGRVKGYVQVQTPNGTEGYVLDTEIPKSALPPAPVEKPNDVESASLAFAATRASKPSNPSIDSPSKATSTAPTKTNWVSSTTVPTHSAPAVVAPTAPSQPQPQVIAAEQPAPSRAPAPAENSSQPNQPNPTVARTAPAPPAPAPTKPTPPPPAPVAVAASAPAPAPANVAPATTISNDATPTIELTSADNSEPAPAPAPQPATIEPARATTHVDAHINIPAKIRPVAAPVDPDGDIETSVEALKNDTSNCAYYFSAYGLSANQYKWIAQNRTKAFPSVCPAPNPSMVDFVVIFTHDVAFYNVTMPSAIHTDQNGLSDWTPLTTVDTAVISASDADHSHHEYVWVFHTKRGAFDPSAFSSRRRPLFSKSETNMLGSRGGFRTVMDALTFIEQNGTNR